jgi:hypothetical protein
MANREYDLSKFSIENCDDGTLSSLITRLTFKWMQMPKLYKKTSDTALSIKQRREACEGMNDGNHELIGIVNKIEALFI